MTLKSRLRLRRKIKREKPDYFRPFWWKKRALKKKKESWRRPHGNHSKVRLRQKGKPPMVETGYGSPREVRGLLPNGKTPIIIHNVRELEFVDKEREAIIIASTVGRKKRAEIVQKANELGIEIFNLTPADKEILSAQAQSQ